MYSLYKTIYQNRLQPAFLAPFGDLGSGAVNTTLSRGAGSATFTRATTATTILSTGLIGSVSSGVARSCYSPAGVYLGYLAEEARTNLCLQSADLTTTWTLGAATIGGSVTLPDGTTGAKNKIQEDNTNAQHLIGQTFTKAASALVYTFSCYLKQADRTWGIIQVDDGTNGNALFFNLATGAIGSNIVVGAGFTSVTYSVQSAANGFYRCIVTATSSTSTSLRFLVETSTGDTTRAYLGTTGSGIYAWGAQLEQAAFATSYIPTTTVAVARNADVLTYPTSGNVVGTAGAAYCEVTFAAGANRYFIELDNAGNHPALYFKSASSKCSIFDGTTESVDSALSASSTVQKLASMWSGAAMKTFVAGSAGTGATFDGDMNPGTNMCIGNSVSAGFPLNGTVKNVRIWTRALADSQLVSLTS